MKIENPAVTLDDDARIGVEEEVRSGFLDWLFTCLVTGDDGELYDISATLLSMNLEQLDLVTFALAKGTGRSRQLRSSIYHVGEYPGAILNRFCHFPAGTMQVDRADHEVVVTCGDCYRVTCSDTGAWHIQAGTGDGEFSVDLVHTPHGFPLWYGREKPSALTQHSITYGYNWAGDVEGTFTYQGETIHVRGTGQRERYVAVDSSAAELGGWEDWGYVAFDQIHSSLYDMRLGMKDLSVYDIERGVHYPEGKMEIEHEDWVFVRELDGFVPERYHISIETEGGMLEMRAHTGNVRTWGVTFRVPDMPVATLVFDHVEGTFTGFDGAVRQLTGGSGVMSIRQWHAYPNILPRELYTDEGVVATDEKFETL